MNGSQHIVWSARPLVTTVEQIAAQRKQRMETTMKNWGIGPPHQTQTQSPPTKLHTRPTKRVYNPNTSTHTTHNIQTANPSTSTISPKATNPSTDPTTTAPLDEPALHNNHKPYGKKARSPKTTTSPWTMLYIHPSLKSLCLRTLPPAITVANQPEISKKHVPPNPDTEEDSHEDATDSDQDNGETHQRPTGQLACLEKRMDSLQSRTKIQEDDDLREVSSARRETSPLPAQKASPPQPSTVRKKGDIFGLLETHITMSNMETVRRSLENPGWEFVSNIQANSPCRILISWNTNKIRMQHCQVSEQWITCELVDKHHNEALTISFIYGRNTPAERGPLWEYLRSRSSSAASSPWIVMGDFNAVLRPSDRHGGDIRWNNNHEEFRTTVCQAGLFQPPYTGVRLTWHNGQQGDNAILKKLDWVKEALKKMHKRNSSHISQRVAAAKIQWDQAQFDVDRNPKL
ncbi:hypothetical protein OIU84_018239 [Salix udensis]|uniref:Endonuclease/exonuclease/phosphatase domain-containing protein n=1 Tax=Salix udensis TaxID=889485 RepID=A0AAD6NNZ1_9ROSI|nr:hypothetical protein OIU84_018239 [Salix udensis]